MALVSVCPAISVASAVVRICWSWSFRGPRSGLPLSRTSIVLEDIAEKLVHDNAMAPVLLYSNVSIMRYCGYDYIYDVDAAALLMKHEGEMCVLLYVLLLSNEESLVFYHQQETIKELSFALSIVTDYYSCLFLVSCVILPISFNQIARNFLALLEIFTIFFC